MIPIINLMIQIEHDPERAIRQAEIFAQSKGLQERTGKMPWFSKIATSLTTHVARILTSGHSRPIKQERVSCSD